MAITQAMCTSFKQELLEATHNFKTSGSGGNTFTTTAYSATNETSGTAYVAGGNTLNNITPSSSGTTAFCDFSDSTWSTSTITARGAVIYNSTSSNKSVAVLDFGSDKSSTSGDFTIQFPTADASNAIIRIA